jgi:glutamyl-tRNA reductase
LAQELATELSGRSASLEAAHTEIAMADIAIVATGSEVPLIIAENLAQARANCATNCYPLLLVDLSMPRNVSVTSGALEGVTLVDLDALQPQVTATDQQRRSAVPAAEAIVETELREFSEWLAASTAREAIRPLREALADVCRKELAHAAGDEVAERLVKRIVAKMMARPMSAVRVAMARGEPVSDLTRTMTTLFAMPAFEATHVSTHSIRRID